MRLAYADPPYQGCAHLYSENEEVDHAILIQRLEAEYDGYILHTASTTLHYILGLYVDYELAPPRIMAWVKPFAAFKKNVSVAYAWEPVLVKAARKPVVRHRVVMRDWFSQSITLKKGLVGAKPEPLVRWALEMMGAEPEDTLDDLYPGTGIVGSTWETWREEVAQHA